MELHEGDLVQNEKTEKHRKNAAPFFSTRSLFDAGVSSIKVDTSIKGAELKLTVHITCHSSVETSDHLGEIFRDVSERTFSSIEQDAQP